MVLLYHLLLFTSIVSASQLPFLLPDNATPPPIRTLSLRHALHLSHTNRTLPILHRTYSSSDLVSLQSLSGHATTQSVRTTRVRRWRPSSNSAFQAARRASFYTPRALGAGRALTVGEMGDAAWGATLEWQEDEIEAPDVRDVETIASLAKMTSNAYSEENGGWYDLAGRWNVSDSFGWLEDGLRGHVFADETNSTVVVAIKGTSAGLLGSGSDTGKNDKINDNLLFSCCCARIDWSWSTVCDCYSSGYTCRQDCIESAVMGNSAYYPVATDLYNNITALYPHAQIWLAGHSLGGALASLLSLTYGVPSVSFEAPGDRLPAQRLHLPLPPAAGSAGYSASEITTHVYHTADPIAMGVCNGALSTCAVAGFALESRCHTGRSIVYDAVGKLGWAVDIRTHRINAVIDNLLIEDWAVPKKGKDKDKDKDEDKVVHASGDARAGWRGWGWWPGGAGKKDPDDGEGGGDGDGEEPPEDDPQHGGRGVPDAMAEDDCVDCFKWEFGESG